MTIKEKLDTLEHVAVALGLLRAYELSGDRSHLDGVRKSLHDTATAIMDEVTT